jgi:chromate transporter
LTRLPLRVGLPVWIRIAALSFGGPAGQIAVMHRLLVEERGWIRESQFLRAMSFCMLLPGPEAQQLATYLGWLLHGKRGGVIAGALFVLPGFLSILALSVLYAELHGTAVLEGIFFGLKPAVMAVVLEAVVRIGKRTLRGRTRMILAAGAFVAVFVLKIAFPLVVLGAALIGYLRLVRDGGGERDAATGAANAAQRRGSRRSARSIAHRHRRRSAPRARVSPCGSCRSRCSPSRSGAATSW